MYVLLLFKILQEKAANALIIAPNTVRTVFGPSGTVVTFSKDMGFPSIFDSKSSRCHASLIAFRYNLNVNLNYYAHGLNMLVHV